MRTPSNRFDWSSPPVLGNGGRLFLSEIFSRYAKLFMMDILIWLHCPFIHEHLSQIHRPIWTYTECGVQVSAKFFSWYSRVSKSGIFWPRMRRDVLFLFRCLALLHLLSSGRFRNLRKKGIACHQIIQDVNFPLKTNMSTSTGTSWSSRMTSNVCKIGFASWTVHTGGSLLSGSSINARSIDLIIEIQLS